MRDLFQQADQDYCGKLGDKEFYCEKGSIKFIFLCFIGS